MNVRSETAALVTRAWPGSVQDVRVLRSHAEEVRNLIGERKLLADLGYAGSQRDVPGIVVCGDEEELRRVRVLVECFFGRLKCIWVPFPRYALLTSGTLIAFSTMHVL